MKEILFEGFGQGFDMHIIAVPSSFAAAIDVLLALSVEEVRDRGINSTNLLAIPEPPIDILQRIFRVLLITVLDIDIADDVIA